MAVREEDHDGFTQAAVSSSPGCFQAVSEAAVAFGQPDSGEMKNGEFDPARSPDGALPALPI
jgi:hypothetical protein